MDTKEMIDSKERHKIRRSLLHLSVVFFLIYTPYRCLECIQSSLNFEDGLGAMSIGVLQGGNFISCLLIGAPFVYKFGPKLSLFISFFSYTLLIFANFHPTWIILMPSSILAGVMSAIIWIAQGTYVTVLAQRYAKYSEQSIAIILSKFSAVFHLFWGASSPVGNLLASVVLGFKDSKDTSNCIQQINLNDTDGYIIGLNQTYNISTGTACQTYSSPDPDKVCGVHHCPFIKEHLEVMQRPSETLVYVLMGAFLVFNISGIIACAFLENVNTERNSSATKKLVQTIKLMRQPNLLLMIFPFILVGMLPGIFYGNFAQSFVSCVFGIGHVGYSLMCEGIGFTFACLICGPLTRIVPRQIQFVLVFASLIAIGFSWLFWVPSVDEFWIVLSISLIYGVMHGLHRTQLSALTSLLFPNYPEPAFAHYHLGRTAAICFTFLISPLFCFTMKAYIFLVTVFLAAISYIILEVKLRVAAPLTETVVMEVGNDDNEATTKEKFLDNDKRFGLILASHHGSLSGSCTNVNIQS